ncbi:MAG TPA: hypothetical protein P5136_00755 [Methanofastidiosum sp.]|nr:hypothetical protein [Methanofastidiosum sp.]
MKAVLKSDCKICDRNQGFVKDFARCKINEHIGLVLIMPSNYNPGIKNGELIVRCPKED